MTATSGRWSRLRARGEAWFVLVFGVGAIGVPIALLVHLLVRFFAGDVAPFLSQENAVFLLYLLLLVAPVSGSLAGRWLWRRNERRAGFLDAAVMPGATGAAAVPSRPRSASIVRDPQQLYLARLRERLETLATSDPARLRWEAIGIVTLGYAYVLAVLVAIVVGILLLVRYDGEFRGLTYRVAYLLGFLGLSVLLSLRVRIPPPEGQRVTSAGSPRLFTALDELRTRIQAPGVDVVQVTTDLNAAVTESPRFGIFGLPRRFLILGLPLMDALPEDELRAILAHELAHLAHRDVPRLHWVARVSVTWQVLAISMEGGRHWARAVFVPFSNWYNPRLQLYASAVSRRDEHDADALAGRASTPAVAARGLVRLHAMGRHLARTVIPGIMAESAERAEPPHDAITRMGRAMREPVDDEHLREDVVHALAERSLDDHSHPSLAERVARLTRSSDDTAALAGSYLPELSAPTGPRAAERLLGASRADALRLQLDGAWQVQTMEHWRALHTAARVWRMAQPSELESEPVMWARARWSYECEPASQAVTLLRALLARYPHHPQGSIYLGKLLAESDDAARRAEGVRLLAYDIWRDTSTALVACEALEKQYAAVNDRAGVDGVQARERALRQLRISSILERRRLTNDDAIVAYRAPAPVIEALHKALILRPTVSRAHLVRKKTELLKDEASVFLAVEVDVSWHRSARAAGQKDASALVERLVVYDDTNFTVIPLERGNSLRGRLRAVHGAEIYRRVGATD